MGLASDEVKKQQFPNFLQVDSVADEWFEELTEAERKDWNTIQTAFRKRWPRKKAAKKTMEEYEEEITGLRLKMEDMKKKEKIAGRDVYAPLHLCASKQEQRQTTNTGARGFRLP